MATTQAQGNDQSRDDYRPSTGLIYGAVGVVLLIAGGLLLANVPVNDNPDLALVGGLLLVGSGTYLIVAGAVARGIQLSRR